MPANPHFHRDESFYNSDSPSNMPSLTPASTLGSSHNASPADHVAGEDVLEDSLFPQLKSDEPNDVEELQKEDPLGVDVWKFYRKQSQLPDAERMQNMTWRMMTINLRKAQRGKSKSVQKHARGWSPHTPYPTREPLSSTTHPPNLPTRRKIAQPRRPNSKPPFPPTPSDNLHAFSVPDDAHIAYYPYDSLSATTHPPSSSHNFNLLHSSGPRGQVQLPPQQQQPQPPRSSNLPVIGLSSQHSRHISLAPPSTTYHQPGTTSSPSPFHQMGSLPHASIAAPDDDGDAVVGWDPGWADEAFGSQALYGAPSTTTIKREEVEEEVGGMLGGGEEDWYGGRQQQLDGSARFGGGVQADWQQQQQHHYYAELLDGGKPKMETEAEGGFADFGFFGGPMSEEGLVVQQQAGHQLHGGGFWDAEEQQSVVAGRKRRKW